jgi:hypothetical protein
MNPRPESAWLAKGPLWVIALSLLTIAGCLVLLVVRTFFPEQPQATSPPAQVGTAAQPQETSGHARREPRDPGYLTQRARVRESEPGTRAGTATDSPQTTLPEPAALPTPRFAAAIRPVSPASLPPLVYAGAVNYETSIKGTVTLKGTPPPETPVELETPCTQSGEPPLTTHFFTTDKNGGLADTLVFISSGLASQSFPPNASTNEFVFTNCSITPYINAVRFNQPLVVTEASGFRHSLHVRSGDVDRAITITPNERLPLPIRLSPDLFTTLSCEVHPWEFAFVSVFPHPFFAVTDEHGEFAITNVPPGRYTLEAVHRNGQKRMTSRAYSEFQLHARQTKSVDFTLVPPPL